MDREEKQRMAKRQARQRARVRARRRKLILGCIMALLIFFIAGVAIVAGLKIGSSRRQDIREQQAQSVEETAAESALEASREAQAESAAAEAEASKEALEAQKAEHDSTKQALAEQTKQANVENSQVLKKISLVGVPGLQAYLNAQTVKAQEQTAPSGGNGHIVCVDAGHEHVDLLDKEPNAPGSDVMKQKVSSGTYGNASGLEEYELNLMVALKLQAVLESRGYQVVMTRTDHEVQLSNIDRAEIANNSGAEIMVRIHANSVDQTDVSGALTFGPSSENPNISPELIAASQRLGQLVIDKFCEATGARNRGYCSDDGLTGVNWSKIPVTYIEMGFMSNPEEDLRMADDGYQNQMAEGLANGIDAYFAG